MTVARGKTWNIYMYTQNGMGVESVPVADALFHADTLEVYYHFLIGVPVPAMGFMITKDIQSIETIQRTLTYKIAEVQRETPWTLYNYVDLEDNTNIVPNIDGTIGHKIKTRNHRKHRTMCCIYNVFVIDRVRGIFDVFRVILNSLLNLT